MTEPIAGPSSVPAKQDKAILPAASAAPVEAVEVLQLKTRIDQWVEAFDKGGRYAINLDEFVRDVRALLSGGQEVRMLTEDEESTLRMCASGTWQGFAAVIQQEFCRVNGLKLAAISATTEPKQ